MVTDGLSGGLTAASFGVGSTFSGAVCAEVDEDVDVRGEALGTSPRSERRGAGVDGDGEEEPPEWPEYQLPVLYDRQYQ
jgi:hypothetical protein